ELWLHLFGDHRVLGARLFAATAIAAGAFGLPWFALQVAGRRAMVNASLLLWPLVHGFTLAMGMLNFAIAVPAALVLLAVLDRQRAAPTIARGLAIAAASFAVWFMHPFPLIVVGALCALEAVRQRDWSGRLRVACALLAPLLPIGLLVVGTALHHL